jgi:hypothetical protein
MATIRDHAASRISSINWHGLVHRMPRRGTRCSGFKIEPRDPRRTLQIRKIDTPPCIQIV